MNDQWFCGAKIMNILANPVSLVFVIVPDGSSGSGRNWSARLDDQLLGAFIQTDEGAIGIARPLVSFQHVFHGGDEAGVGVSGITHCRLRWGLRTFFLKSFRSCCRWPSRRCSIRRPSPRAGGTGVSDCSVPGNHLSVLTSPSEAAILHRNDPAPAIVVGRGEQSFGAGGGMVREGPSGYANPRSKVSEPWM